MTSFTKLYPKLSNCEMHSYRNGTHKHFRPNALRANKPPFLLFKTVSIFTEILSVDSNQPIVVYHFFYSFGPSISSVRFFLRNGAFEVTFREQIIRLVPFSKTYRLFFAACHLDTFNPKISDCVPVWVFGSRTGHDVYVLLHFSKMNTDTSACVCVRRCLTEWESKSESESHKTH